MYDASRFLQSITKGKAAPQQVPIAVSKADAKPPATVEPKPSDKLDEADGIDYLRRSGALDDAEDFQIAAFIEACRAGYVTHGNVNEIVANIKQPIVPEPSLVPKPTVVLTLTPTTTPAPAPAKPVAPIPPPKPEDDLPELPPYVVRALGNNPLRTRADIRRIASQVYSDLYRGPHQSAFKARIDAILSRK